MRGIESLLLRIIGAMLILVGVVVFASPQISFTTREEIANTALNVKREKTFVIPRPASALLVAAGVAVLILPEMKPQR